jgi:hypothetical protein
MCCGAIQKNKKKSQKINKSLCKKRISNHPYYLDGGGKPFGNLRHPVARVVLMTTTPTRFAVTVDEHMLVKYTRYKYYDMPQGMELPFEWNEWDADARYEWINENCHFRTMEDHAEEYDSECVHDYGTEVEYE